MNPIEKICDYFKNGENENCRLGLELEHFVCNEQFEVPSYGLICEFIEEIHQKTGAQVYKEQDCVCGVIFDNYTVSLEPAGQVEISITPKNEIGDIAGIYGSFLELWEPMLGSRGFHFVRKGVHPLVENGTAPAEHFPLIPKQRYQHMDRHFMHTGRYGRYMMRTTASTQVSIDYASEADAVLKYQLLEKISPLLSLLLEDLSYNGRRKDFLPHCLRLQIWNGTDPDRCGYIPGSLDGSFGYRKYAEYVYHNPMILTREGDRIIGTGNLSAAEYSGRKDDAFYEYLLSMFFPNIRLKRYLEIRIADSTSFEKVLGYLALIKGLFYTKGIDTLKDLLSPVTSTREIYEAESRIMQHGCRAVVYGKNAADWLLVLCDIARANLGSADRDLLRSLVTLPLLEAACCREIQNHVDIHRESMRVARQYIMNSTAKYHNRAVKALYLPKFFTQADIDAFRGLILQLYGIFDKVVDEYRRDPGYRKLFGFSPVLEKLILREKNYGCNIPIARIDLFYDESTRDFTFCEFNTDGASAMNEDRELNHSFRLTELYRVLNRQYEVSSFELFDSWVEEFLLLYGEFAKTHNRPATPNVAIVDFMESATVNEFEIFAQRFTKRGVRCEICEIRDLQWDGKRCRTPGGMEVDAVYRRAVTSDILSHLDEIGALLNAVESNAVCLVGDFQTQIVHNKLLFKILHLPRTKEFLTEAEKGFVESHVPYTVSLEEGLRGSELLKEVLSDKDSWIIKPEDSYGSRGVYSGTECDPPKWKEVVLENIGKHYLLQKFCVPYTARNTDFSDYCGGDINWRNVSNLTGLFVYNGKMKGIYSRISFDKMISTQYNEMAVPTVVVSPRK